MKKFIFLFIAVFLFQHLYNSPSSGIAQTHAAEAHNEVILYATAWCGYCKKTRAFLAENNIEYTEYDVESSAEGHERHQALGGGGVPVLDIRGTVIHGYSVKKMTSTLKSFDLM